jgi:hypothetical protein
MIDSTPEIVGLAVNPHEHLVHVPAPTRKRVVLNSTLANLGSKHWAEPVPPETNRLVADVYPTLEQQILDLPQR